MSTEAYKKRKRDWAKTESQKEYRRNYMRRWRAKNLERSNELARESHARNRHKHIDKYRAYHLKKTYNITEEDFQEMLLKQEGKCLICGKSHKEASRGLHIDHDHSTGKIRGLLCSKCNGSLGWYEKHKALIENYLKDIVY